jgi:hypothetical protein
MITMVGRLWRPAGRFVRASARDRRFEALHGVRMPAAFHPNLAQPR